ncbi:hypothetical protein G6F37_000540 [Rhizopus arrhizus]|nr:hypothetical protein G6F38_003195 [Rhizopus arrhizus]KAG1164169.1 hypothetical protein G6F37_000540 [Rhizopus arrhizus]
MLLYHNNPQCFDTNKWKRKFNFTLKLNRTHPHYRNGSATAKAAATEKFIRKNMKETIISEDLTASQFANLTGIKTKRDDEESSSDDDADSTSTSTSQPLTIWDSHFWLDRRFKHSIPISQSQPCISSIPLTRHRSEPTVIQKGRFKIIWGMDDNEPMVTTTKSNCVEWKRKKNM